MLFSIDSDTGEQIVGWILPDNPNATPKVNVRVKGATRSIEATVFRPLLKEQGLHNHGICGFVVGAHNLPGLAEVADLAIEESETGVLVYSRRAATRTIARKLLRVETQLLFDRVLDRVLGPQFQMAYTRFETIPDETSRTILRIGYSSSLYVSGRIYPKAIDDLARSRGFQFGVVLRDPYEELAERLIILRWSAEKPGEAAAALGGSVTAAVGAMPALDLGSVESLRRSLPRMTAEPLTRCLSNPLTRQLTCLEETEELGGDAVAAALDYLGSFEIVGLQSQMATTLETIGAALDVASPLTTTSPGVSALTKSLADLLREVAFCEELIGRDLQLYGAAAQAFKRAGEVTLSG